MNSKNSVNTDIEDSGCPVSCAPGLHGKQQTKVLLEYRGVIQKIDGNVQVSEHAVAEGLGVWVVLACDTM